eukprot:1638138-Rhodomonas_salina.2
MLSEGEQSQDHPKPLACHLQQPECNCKDCFSHLLSQVVADLDDVLDLGALRLLAVDVDGEMRVHELHLVLVPAGDPDNHVADVRDDSAHSSELLLGSEPLLDLEKEANSQPTMHAREARAICLLHGLDTISHAGYLPVLPSQLQQLRFPN